MIIKVKFEFLTGLKNDCFIFEADSFEENGTEFVKTLYNLTDGVAEAVPPYCRLKDLPGVIQASHPTARVEVEQEKELS